MARESAFQRRMREGKQRPGTTLGSDVSNFFKARPGQTRADYSGDPELSPGGAQADSAGFERAALALGGAQAGLSMGFAINKAKFAELQGDYETQIEGYKAQLQDLNIQDAYRRGIEQKEQVRLAARRLKSERTVAFAGQNVLLGFGTPEQLDISDDEMTVRELAAIDASTLREVQFFEREKLAAEHRGRMAGMAAKFARQSALVQGGLQALGIGAGMYAGAAKAPKA